MLELIPAAVTPIPPAPVPTPALQLSPQDLVVLGALGFDAEQLNALAMANDLAVGPVPVSRFAAPDGKTLVINGERLPGAGVLSAGVNLQVPKIYGENLVKAAAGLIRNLGSLRERATRANIALVKAARREIIADGGRSTLRWFDEAKRVLALRFFDNPLGAIGGLGHVNGTPYIVLAGSAVRRVLTGETPREASGRLEQLLVPNPQQPVQVFMGGPTRRVRHVMNPVGFPGCVGVVVELAFPCYSMAHLRRELTQLENALDRIGPQPIALVPEADLPGREDLAPSAEAFA